MARDIDHALCLTEQWLRGEHDYQFRRSDPMFNGDHTARLRHLMEEETPNRWYQFQLLAEAGSESGAGQRLMKVCAAARACVVVSGLLQGRSFVAANQASWRCFGGLPVMNEDDVRNWSGNLSQPFESSIARGINRYSADHHVFAVRPAFHNAVRLVVARLCTEDSMVVPEPGHPSGEIIEWRPEV